MPTNIEIVEQASSTNKGRMKVMGIFGVPGEPTGNGRLYNESLMDREIKKLNILIESNAGWAEADHPGDGKSTIKNTAARFIRPIEKITLEQARKSYPKLAKNFEDDDGKKKIYVGEAMILKEPPGPKLQEMIESGGRVDTSQRGWGSIAPGKWNGKDVNIVDDDYNLKTFDFVIGGAVKGASVSELREQMEVVNLIEVGSCEGCPKENQQKDMKGGTKVMEIKTLEELRKAYPELCLQLEGEAKVSREKELKEAMQAEWEAKTKEIAEGIKKQIEESQEYKDFKAGMGIHKATLIEIGKLVKPYISEGADDDDAQIEEQVKTLKTELETARGESKVLKEQMEREKKEAVDKVKAERRIEEVIAGKEHKALLVERLSSCKTAEEVDKRLTEEETYIKKVLGEVKPGDQARGTGQILDENLGEGLTEQQKRDQRVAGIA